MLAPNTDTAVVWPSCALARASTPERSPGLGKTPKRAWSARISDMPRAWLLARCLTVLAKAGINLSKLESRPKPGRAWEYMFYADLEGDAADPSIAEALAAVRALCTEFRLLGSYDVPAPIGAAPWMWLLS